MGGGGIGSGNWVVLSRRSGTGEEGWYLREGSATGSMYIEEEGNILSHTCSTHLHRNMRIFHIQENDIAMQLTFNSLPQKTVPIGSYNARICSANMCLTLTVIRLNTI